MNMDDKLLIRSLAALGEDTTEDHDVERHLAEFHVAYAQLTDDPTLIEQLDALVAEEDPEFLESGNALLADPGTRREVELWERILELQEKELQALRARLDALGEKPRLHQPQWVNRVKSLAPSFTSLATLMMIAASVVLGIFDSLSQLGTILLMTVFAATSALVVLMRSFLLFDLARRASYRPRDAERVMRLLLGGLSVEMRAIEAREKVAACSLQPPRRTKG